jgi:hypothetical protein
MNVFAGSTISSHSRRRPTQQELKRRALAKEIKQDIVRGYHRLGGLGTGDLDDSAH